MSKPKPFHTIEKFKEGSEQWCVVIHNCDLPLGKIDADIDWDNLTTSYKYPKSKYPISHKEAWPEINAILECCGMQPELATA